MPTTGAPAAPRTRCRTWLHRVVGMACVILSGCSQPATVGSSVQVTDSAGVVIVRNGSEGDGRYVLSEELRIGEQEGEEPYLLDLVRGEIAVVRL